MVRRSLVFKIYLYAAAAFFVSLPPAFYVGRTLVEMGHRENQQHGFLGPQLSFIERELERSLVNGAPPPGRVQELEVAFHHTIRFVPWSDRGAYPAALVSEDQIFDRTPPERGPHHWVRVDLNGKPVGALDITPMGPGGRGGRGRHPRPEGFLMPRLAWIWVLMLVLIIVPPLWLWVIRPLRAMVEVARRLGSGDLDTPVTVDRRDEFGELERAFEHMRVELRRLIQQKEHLLTDVSHEIRGPLARMMLALPLLRQEGASGPITEIFEQELRTADGLLSDVLALARGSQPAALNAVPTDLAELARPLVNERNHVLSVRGLALESQLDPAPLSGDERLLVRAMGNLLDNALKYTSAGDTVRVVTGRENGQAFFRVEDHGPGISAEHLPHLFEPFYRPDTSRSRETGGVGLGLSIVKRIAESHGGQVLIDSREGAGTHAEIRLPARQPAELPEGINA